MYCERCRAGLPNPPTSCSPASRGRSKPEGTSNCLSYALEKVGTLTDTAAVRRNGQIRFGRRDRPGQAFPASWRNRYSASSACSASARRGSTRQSPRRARPALAAAALAPQGGGKQRQDRRRDGRPGRRASPLSSCASTSLARLHHGIGKAGEPRHLDAVATVGRALGDLVQEHHVALPLLDPHRDVADARQLAASAVISWKCVAKIARQRFCSCRYSTAAQAIDRPSKVAVPRPISSRMTRLVRRPG